VGTRQQRKWTGPGPWLAIVALAAGCIIPDLQITEQREVSNPGTVRIVEPTPVTRAANTACDAVPAFADCPNVFDTLPSGELKGQGDLCTCGENQSDDNAPGGFRIFVEDSDLDEEGDPKDDIFGAFLLDVPAGATDLTQFQAYTRAVPPDVPAALEVTAYRTIERDQPRLRVFQVAGNTLGSFDVCNDNDGNELAPGLHELRFVVTDRPWYAPPDPTGDLDDEGNPLRGDALIGVPDLAAGATYASTAFVFRCVDATEPGEALCACFGEEEPT